jgi:NAD(P)-dependent dehydrogenase (short-subunit alcohol dehydrogenase family)
MSVADAGGGSDPGDQGTAARPDEGLAIPPDYVARLFDISGRVAVVTGGGSGLGQAIAIGFAQAGVSVVVADVNDEGAAETVGLVAEQGHEAQAEPLDVTQRAEVEGLADKVVERFGRVDILVNSAGSAYRSPAEDFPEDKLDFILDLNLKGTYLASQAFGRKMLAQGKGSIINLASIGSFVAYPWASAYLASKGGVLGITRAMALEWRDRGVRVNGIGPTLMDSPLTRQAAQRTSLTADFIKARMLRPRLGLPRELIGAAIFLASDASELVTGHTVMCDDGYLTA